jgi:hypothetical protein
MVGKRRPLPERFSIQSRPDQGILNNQFSYHAVPAQAISRKDTCLRETGLDTDKQTY